MSSVMLSAHSERQAACSDFSILITALGGKVIAPSLTALIPGRFL